MADPGTLLLNRNWAQATGEIVICPHRLTTVLAEHEPVQVVAARLTDDMNSAIRPLFGCR